MTPFNASPPPQGGGPERLVALTVEVYDALGAPLAYAPFWGNVNP